VTVSWASQEAGERHSGAASPSLEQLLRPVDRVSIAHPAGRAGGWEWLSSGEWRIPATPSDRPTPAGELIERFSRGTGQTLAAIRSADGTVVLPFDPDEAYRNYVTEAWRADARDLHALSATQLAVYYRVKRLLPRGFWLALRRARARRASRPAFPAWPLETGVERLLRFYAQCHLLAEGAEQAAFRWFWPGNHTAALVLTHDVESAEGLRLALDLADLEQDRGFRSSFNIVGAQYPIDHVIVRELQQRGFEVGLHGLYHDRSLFSSRGEFERQVPLLADSARLLGAEGFRSPSTHRVIDWLPELPVEYDCTVPHSDPYEPQPGGCATIWPYMLGRLVEVPYTLPQDHTLFTVLGRRSVQPWLDQAAEIEDRFGMIQCLSHPDRGYLGDADKRAVYREFLDALAERDRLWPALPRDVARWWRNRESRGVIDPAQLLGTMRLGESPGYAVLTPPVSAAVGGGPARCH
jgi:peptidoglycan/xylan/chitin deacetylase (PgdA/CDA1 family)